MAVSPSCSFMLCCERLLHSETHGHRTAELAQHKASFLLDTDKHLSSSKTTTISLSKEVTQRLTSITQKERKKTKTKYRFRDRDRQSVTTFRTYPICLQSPCTDSTIAFIFYIFICVSYLLSSFFSPSHQNCMTCFIFCISAYHLFNLLWQL